MIPDSWDELTKLQKQVLVQWGRMTYVCVSIIWTSDDLLSIWPEVEERISMKFCLEFQIFIIEENASESVVCKMGEIFVSASMCWIEIFIHTIEYYFIVMWHIKTTWF